MTITEEDFKKMFELVREIHVNYTKNVERENEVLRNMLTEAQQKLDEALALVEKLRKTIDTLEKTKNIHDFVRDHQDNDWTKTLPGSGPWVAPGHGSGVPTWQIYTTSTLTNPICTSATNMQNEYERYIKHIKEANMYSKADEDG